MTDRSPIQLIGDILDEVEGLRRTDPRSHLPERLLAQMRDALAPHAPPGAATGPVDLTSLVGETIEHVFESGVTRGDVLILCSSGAFCVLEVGDPGDDSYISSLRGFGGLKDHLKPRELEQVGLITRAEREEADKKLMVEAAERQLARAQADAKRAETALNKLKGIPA